MELGEDVASTKTCALASDGGKAIACGRSDVQVAGGVMFAGRMMMKEA